MTTTPINPTNWYWIVANSTTQVYSSAIGDFVPVSDSTYQIWLNRHTPVDVTSERNLAFALVPYLQRPSNSPTAATVLSFYQNILAGNMDKVVFGALFDHENRIRTLAGQPTVTSAQYLSQIAGQI